MPTARPSIGHTQEGFTVAGCAVGGGALVQCPESLLEEVPPTGTWVALGVTQVSCFSKGTESEAFVPLSLGDGHAARSLSSDC